MLLVEDDFLVRECTAALLVELGCEVIEADNGLDALALLREVETVRLLFTDCRMPGMDGPTLAAIAARMRPGLAIVLATGYHDALPTHWPILHKPYLMAHVQPVLERLLPELSSAAA